MDFGLSMTICNGLFDCMDYRRTLDVLSELMWYLGAWTVFSIEDNC